jgi:hypothetical protein
MTARGTLLSETDNSARKVTAPVVGRARLSGRLGILVLLLAEAEVVAAEIDHLQRAQGQDQ